MRIVKLDDPIKIIESKQEIESKLIENKKIDSAMELQDFIKFLDLQNTIYVKDDLVVPFRLYDDMLFIIAENDIISEVSEILKEIEYNFSNLKQVSNSEVYSGELDKYKYFFIIDSKYMVK
jgi:hypothetical protein